MSSLHYAARNSAKFRTKQPSEQPPRKPHTIPSTVRHGRAHGPINARRAAFRFSAYWVEPFYSGNYFAGFFALAGFGVALTLICAAGRGTLRFEPPVIENLPRTLPPRGSSLSGICASPVLWLSWLLRSLDWLNLWRGRWELDVCSLL